MVLQDYTPQHMLATLRTRLLVMYAQVDIALEEAARSYEKGEAVRAIAAQLRAAASRVCLPLLTPEGIARVPVDEIMWAESFGKRQTLVLTTGALEVRHTLRELCEKLEPHGFLQVHRCYVVSCRYIFSIEAGRLIMDDRREIPISRYRLAACKEAFRRSISHGLDAAEHRPQGDL